MIYTINRKEGIKLIIILIVFLLFISGSSLVIYKFIKSGVDKKKFLDCFQGVEGSNVNHAVVFCCERNNKIFRCDKNNMTVGDSVYVFIDKNKEIRNYKQYFSHLCYTTNLLLEGQKEDKNMSTMCFKDPLSFSDQKFNLKIKGELVTKPLLLRVFFANNISTELNMSQLILFDTRGGQNEV